MGLNICSGNSLDLSRRARSLWGKSVYGAGGVLWLPLYVHMSDSVEVARLLWQDWVPRGTRDMVSRAIGDDEELAAHVLYFLAGVHDLGKATPLFQAKPCTFESGGAESLRWKPERAGLAFKEAALGARWPSHPIAGQMLLEKYLRDSFGFSLASARSFASVVGTHHGKPPGGGEMEYARSAGLSALGLDDWYAGSWHAVQQELIGFVRSISGLDNDDLRRLKDIVLPAFCASILTGLVIMCDWMASNSLVFDLAPADQPDDVAPWCEEGRGASLELLRQRARRAWDDLDILPSWEEPRGDLATSADELFEARFRLPVDARPYPVQEAAFSLAQQVEDPGMLMIIESQMGDGKTEAALAAAEILAVREGLGGVCIALPTMATTDAMFGRAHAWLSRLPDDRGSRSVYLAHGKARLNEEFQGIVRASGGWRLAGMGQDLGDGGVPEGVVVSEWMRGRKKGMLANFVVCTVDQVLMGALAMKHLPLRQLALANKVVIIDECHGYDAYMRQYLGRVLEWLGSWRTPVILLSATLPSCQRSEMVESYLRGRRASALRAARRRPAGSCFTGRRPRRTVGPAPEEAACDAKGLSTGSRLLTYPLITYTDGDTVKTMTPASSGRGLDVRVCLVADDDDSLRSLLRESLAGGGCAGVVCSTVTRAQRAYEILAQEFGENVVSLDHARFIDFDRMAHERRLRERLGPRATLANGGRPHLSIVVGTQVLEQSLDIDFDLLVTDVAPVDLFMQRLGRVHRHARGAEEGERPARLRMATCYMRGVKTWESGAGPAFSRSVYDEASLIECLAILGLDGPRAEVTLRLPDAIAQSVEAAYGPEAVRYIPSSWHAQYEEAIEGREAGIERKISRARACLLPSVEDMCRNERTLTDWYDSKLDVPVERSRLLSDDDRGAARCS